MQTPAQLREHFEVETELRQRLMDEQDTGRRRQLYGEVYAERILRLPHHPLVTQSADPAARSAAAAPQVRLLAPFLRPTDTFVELGAHDGAVAAAVAPLVARSIALDVHDAVALPSRGRYEFRVCDGFDLGLPPDSVDVVYSRDVVEHLHPEDFADHASAVRDVLRRGGRYVCVTPNRLTGPHDVSRHFSDTPRGFHLREYSASELTRALRGAGFSAVKIFLSYHGRHLTPTLPGAVARPLEAAVATVPRRRRLMLTSALAGLKVVATA